MPEGHPVFSSPHRLASATDAYRIMSFFRRLQPQPACLTGTLEPPRSPRGAELLARIRSDALGSGTTPDMHKVRLSPGACNQVVIPALAHAKKLGSKKESYSPCIPCCCEHIAWSDSGHGSAAGTVLRGKRSYRKKQIGSLYAQSHY